MERSDAELLAASRRGERDAFGALVERYQGVVCAVSYSRTGNRALSEDVAQETFLAAWRQLDQLREVERLRSWLCGIARNLAAKAYRRGARETSLEEAPFDAQAETPFDSFSERESEQVVRDALHRVPLTYREVLVLYYREQRSVKEVAATLGISESATLQRLTRGRQYLASGVTTLVERSLRGALPRKSLVAGVLAALPAFAPSHAKATPRSHGETMFKLALVAAAFTAAGTSAYVKLSGAAKPPAPAVATATAAPAAVLAPTPAAPAAAPAGLSAVAAAAAPIAAAEAPAEPPLVEAATIARLRLHEGPSLGAATAPVTIVMFSDMQCKYCGDALGSLDQLSEDYPSKVRVVMKQMPVHKTAVLASEALLAAAAQDKFWALHDLMMSHQDELTRDGILTLARQAGLEVDKMAKALDLHTYAAAVQADMKAASELEIQGTPAFVINGRRVIGNRPIAEFRQVIDEALADL